MEQKELERSMTKREFLECFIGAPVFLMCARYSYRGTVVGVSDDAVILKDAFAVFSTGTLSSSKVTEEPIPGVSLWALDAIEHVAPFMPFLLGSVSE
jgi:hypothetical protein